MNNELENIIKSGYGMYTTAGSKSIENKFRTLIKKLEKEDIDLSGKINAITKLIKSYRAMGNTKSYGESSDTAVREEVWFTLVKVVERFGVPEIVADWIWYSTY